jgi:hypothetical protein
MRILGMTLSFLLMTSCSSLFRGNASLGNRSVDELLASVKLTGEGKGRLTLEERSYVFGVDSILKENQDWILAVAIPLHGEEVMILPDLKKIRVDNEETETFEDRIEREFQQMKLNKVVSSKDFLHGVRSLVRFSLAHTWGQFRNCKEQEKGFFCSLDGEEFLVEPTPKELKITKILGNGHSLQLVAKNLTDSFFQQNSIRLLLKDSPTHVTTAPISLELFW